MIITKTPLRVSFFGGGTDLPDFYQGYRGAVIGSAIDKFVYHSVFRFPSKLFDYNTRISYSQVECVNSLDEIKHSPYREILRDNGIEGDIEMHVSSDLPSFSGLGSSSSFTVGLLKALSAFKGNHISQYDLANNAIRIEREVLNEAVGCQDQIFASYGGFNLIEFNPNGNFNVERLAISTNRIQELNDSLMLFFTGITRRAQNVEAEKIKNISNLSKSLKLIYSQVEIANSILVGNKSLHNFGLLLDQTWKEKKLLANGVSNSIIDSIYKRAIESGAVGGKLLGAGGGGFFLFYVEPEKKEFVRKALSDLHEIKINLNAPGSSIIHS